MCVRTPGCGVNTGQWHRQYSFASECDNALSHHHTFPFIHTIITHYYDMDATHNSNVSRILRLKDQDHSIEIRLEAHAPSVSVNPFHHIRFRHPYYPDSNNVLLSLFALDAPSLMLWADRCL